MKKLKFLLSLVITIGLIDAVPSICGQTASPATDKNIIAPAAAKAIPAKNAAVAPPATNSPARFVPFTERVSSIRVINLNPKAPTTPPPTVRQPEPKAAEVRKLLDRAQKTETSKPASNTIEVYKELEQASVKEGDRQTAAFAVIQQARTLETSAALMPNPAEQKSAAEKLYKKAIDDATAENKAIAQNNLGALYLKQGKAVEAAEVLRGIDWKTVDPRQEYVCRFNVAKAAELNRDTTMALAQYKLALASKPTSAPAAEAAFNLLLSEKNYKEAAVLANDLTSKAPNTRVATNLHRALAGADGANAKDLLQSLVRCYTAQRWSLERLKGEIPLLQSYRVRYETIAKPCREAILAISREFEVTLNSYEARNQFQGWSELNAAVFSRFLFYLGEQWNADDPSGKIPLGYYETAFALDALNTDAALYASSILLEKKEASTNPTNELQNLASRIFDAKEKGYQIPIEKRSPADVENLFRLHLILASIYEKMGQWGGDPYNPWTALFQLRMAANLEPILNKQLRVPFSPDVSRRLAFAYLQTGDRSNAFRSYLRAGALQESAGDIPSAKESVQVIETLGVTPDENESRQLKELKGRLGL